MDEAIFIFRAPGVIFILFSFFDEIPDSKQNCPRWDAAFSASPLGLFCLSISHKKDARLMLVKIPGDSCSKLTMSLVNVS